MHAAGRRPSRPQGGQPLGRRSARRRGRLPGRPGRRAHRAAGRAAAPRRRLGSPGSRPASPSLADAAASVCRFLRAYVAEFPAGRPSPGRRLWRAGRPRAPRATCVASSGAAGRCFRAIAIVRRSSRAKLGNGVPTSLERTCPLRCRFHGRQFRVRRPWPAARRGRKPGCGPPISPGTGRCRPRASKVSCVSPSAAWATPPLMVIDNWLSTFCRRRSANRAAPARSVCGITTTNSSPP